MQKLFIVQETQKIFVFQFFKNFFLHQKWNGASSQTDIANFYNLYKQTMEFWNKILGNSIYNIKYESLINDQEKKYVVF